MKKVTSNYTVIKCPKLEMKRNVKRKVEKSKRHVIHRKIQDLDATDLLSERI
jgi:hypothetical protein